jgi:hypothetical protein
MGKSKPDRAKDIVKTHILKDWAANVIVTERDDDKGPYLEVSVRFHDEVSTVEDGLPVFFQHHPVHPLKSTRFKVQGRQRRCIACGYGR